MVSTASESRKRQGDATSTSQSSKKAASGGVTPLSNLKFRVATFGVEKLSHAYPRCQVAERLYDIWLPTRVGAPYRIPFNLVSEALRSRLGASVDVAVDAREFYPDNFGKSRWHVGWQYLQLSRQACLGPGHTFIQREWPRCCKLSRVFRCRVQTTSP